MFGYLRPDLPNLYMKDDTLYKSLYCGVCKSIGATCGQMARMTLTYDAAFLSAVVHNAVGTDVTVKRKRCVAHWIKPRPIAGRDELTDKIAAFNLILAYYKLTDDIIDSKKGKIKRAFISKGYKKAKKLCPEIDKAVQIGYNKLREVELKRDGVIDRAADPFAEMLAASSEILFGERADGHTRELFYLVGKWIYLIDALDDYDKDAKSGNYNPFYCAYGEKSCRELIKNHGGDIDFIFATLFKAMGGAMREINFAFNSDLIANIIMRGIPQKTREVVKAKLNDEQKL